MASALVHTDGGMGSALVYTEGGIYSMIAAAINDKYQVPRLMIIHVISVKNDHYN